MMNIGVLDNHESPSIRCITRSKDDSQCRKLGSKISLIISALAENKNVKRLLHTYLNSA